MSKFYTSNTLIESVKRKAMLPVSTSTFQDGDFLAFANEEMDLGVVPLVMSFHEDYLMFTAELPLITNTIRYEIPSRAMGNKIRDVQYKDSNGTLYEMTRILIEDLPYFQNGSGGSISGAVRSFYLEGNEIVLAGGSNATNFSGNLMVSYYLRCGELVAEDRSARITDINTTTGVLTLDRWPDNFSLTPLIDFTAIRSPHKLIKFDVQPTAYGNLITPQITLALSDIPVQLRVGDVATTAEETIIPQIPLELHGMLAQRVVLRCLEALGDIAGLQAAAAKLQEMEQKSGNILDSRVEGAPFKVAPKHTFLRRSRTYLRR